MDCAWISDIGSASVRHAYCLAQPRVHITRQRGGMTLKAALCGGLLTILWLSPATAAGLHPDSKAADWLSATATEQQTWVVMVSRVASSRAATPRYLAGCITGMLTPRNRNERQIVNMLKDKTLAEISALCAVSAGMDAIELRRR